MCEMDSMPDSSEVRRVFSVKFKIQGFQGESLFKHEIRAAGESHLIQNLQRVQVTQSKRTRDTAEDGHTPNVWHYLWRKSAVCGCPGPLGQPSKSESDSLGCCPEMLLLLSFRPASLLTSNLVHFSRIFSNIYYFFL